MTSEKQRTSFFHFPFQRNDFLGWQLQGKCRSFGVNLGLLTHKSLPLCLQQEEGWHFTLRATLYIYLVQQIRTAPQKDTGATSQSHLDQR